MDESFGRYIQRFIVEPCRKWIYRSTCQMLVVLFVALLVNFVFSYGFTTPKMWHLGRVNNQLVSEYNTLNEKIAKLNSELDMVIDHDHNLYHSVFGTDTLSDPLVWTLPDDDFYSRFAYGRYSDIMISTERNFDKFTHRLYGASVSMQQVESFAVSKDVMMDHIPTIWPVDRSAIKSIGAFGWRVHPILHFRRMHYGVDLAGDIGTPVYATGDGMVVDPGSGTGYGRQILIDHQFGYKTRYAHLNRIFVTEGKWVHRGEIIGELGNSGLSKGPHLHYEVLLKGDNVNPMSYLRKDLSEDEFEEIIENSEETTFEVD